ncbi:MAG: nucleotidyltransferase domain-containing protein [bacterium]
MTTILRERRKKIRLERYNNAYDKIRKVGEFLYQKGAKKVYFFGSIINPDAFTEHSDIDIAVEGISEEKRVRVETDLSELLNGLEYDLIFLEDKDEIKKEILDRIEKEAILWKP